jgi:hypothetical protein
MNAFFAASYDKVGKLGLDCLNVYVGKDWVVAILVLTFSTLIIQLSVTDFGIFEYTSGLQ